MPENRKNPLSGVFKGTDPNPPKKPATPLEPPKKEEKPATPKQPEGKAPEPPKKSDEKPKSEPETPKDKAPEKPTESPKPEDKPATQPEPKTEGKPKSEPVANKPPEDEIPPDFSIEPVVTESSMGMVTSIPIDLIDDFEGHPYAVRDDNDMQELVESIKQVGVLEPVVVIPNAKKPGRFEMVSGHRRKHAAKLAGGTKILHPRERLGGLQGVRKEERALLDSEGQARRGRHGRPDNQRGLRRAGQSFYGAPRLRRARKGGGRPKKRRVPRSTRQLLETARDWLESIAIEDDDGF